MRFPAIETDWTDKLRVMKEGGKGRRDGYGWSEMPSGMLEETM